MWGWSRQAWLFRAILGAEGCGAIRRWHSANAKAAARTGSARRADSPHAPPADAPVKTSSAKSSRLGLGLGRWRTRMTVQHPPPLAFTAIDIGGYRLLTEPLARLAHLDMLCHDRTDHARAAV